MRTISIFFLFIAVGCANPGIVQISPGTYMLSREDHAGIFGNPSAMKASVISDANAFASKQGKVAIPISSESTPSYPLHFATFEYQFRVVDPNDPAVQSTPLVRPAPVAQSSEQQIANELKRQNDNAEAEQRIRGLQQMQNSLVPAREPAQKTTHCTSTSGWLPGSRNYGTSFNTECSEH